jgi:hypothetical protein
MVLIRMGFKGCFTTLATNLGYPRVSHRPPPDPDSTGSTKLFSWLLPFACPTALRFGLLSSFISPASGFDLQLSSPTTALTWLLGLSPPGGS